MSPLESWRNWARLIPDTPTEQLNQMRMAFYSGYVDGMREAVARMERVLADAREAIARTDR